MWLPTSVKKVRPSMNDRLTRKILSEARASLEPTAMDRDRLHRKVMGAVGANAVVTTAGAGTAKVAGGIAATGAPAGAVAAIKLIAGGALLVGVIALGPAGGLSYFSTSPLIVRERHQAVNPTTDAPPRRTQSTVQKTLNSPIVQPPMHNNASAEAPQRESVNSVAIPPKVRQRTKAKKSPDAPPDDNALFREIAMIRNAPRAIHNKNFSNAMQFLEQYDSAFPNGMMRPERDGLVIQALCGAGETEKARRAHRAFREKCNKPPLMFQVDETCIGENKQTPDKPVK